MKDKALSEIRKIAYGLWMQEGRPDGQDRRHWDTAKEIWAFRHSGEDAPQQGEEPSSKALKAARAGNRGNEASRSRAAA